MNCGCELPGRRTIGRRGGCWRSPTHLTARPGAMPGPRTPSPTTRRNAASKKGAPPGFECRGRRPSDPAACSQGSRRSFNNRADIRNCLKRGEVGADEVTGRMKRQAYSSDLTDAEWQRITLLLPRRWAVERTCAWLSQKRRLSKDYERLCTSESMISGALTRLMLRRRAQS